MQLIIGEFYKLHDEIVQLDEKHSEEVFFYNEKGYLVCMSRNEFEKNVSLIQ